MSTSKNSKVNRAGGRNGRVQACTLTFRQALPRGGARGRRRGEEGVRLCACAEMISEFETDFFFRYLVPGFSPEMAFTIHGHGVACAVPGVITTYTSLFMLSNRLILELLFTSTLLYLPRYLWYATCAHLGTTAQ